MYSIITVKTTQDIEKQPSAFCGLPRGTVDLTRPLFRLVDLLSGLETYPVDHVTSRHSTAQVVFGAHHVPAGATFQLVRTHIAVTVIHFRADVLTSDTGVVQKRQQPRTIISRSWDVGTVCSALKGFDSLARQSHMYSFGIYMRLIIVVYLGRNKFLYMCEERG